MDYGTRKFIAEIYESLPQYDVKIVLGDLNAQIGREEIYEGTIGKQPTSEIKW